jgi:hypothetical protein
MPFERPFILIASLRRTGSTVLSEALSQLPFGFVFRELRLGENRFDLKPDDAALFSQHGVHLDRLARGWRLKRLWKRSFVDCFRDDVLPRLEAIVEQVGVKEIRLDGWRHYVRVFPEIRVLLTARDPRDIFLSIVHRRRRDAYDPAEVAAGLNRDFEHQMALSKAAKTLKVRYEDLCSDAGVLEKARAFAGSRVPEHAGVGQFNAANPERKGEYEVHGGKITDRRVGRWRSEPDKGLVAQAEEVFARMPAYCEFWGYER